MCDCALNNLEGKIAERALERDSNAFTRTETRVQLSDIAPEA